MRPVERTNGSCPCMRCGIDRTGEMVDLGDLMLAGGLREPLYLCSSCLGEAAGVVGGATVPRARFEVVEAQVERQAQELRQKTADLAAAQSELAELKPAFARTKELLVMRTNERSSMASTIAEQAEKLDRLERGLPAMPLVAAKLAFDAAAEQRRQQEELRSEFDSRRSVPSPVRAA